MNTAYSRGMLADNPLTGRMQFTGQPQAGLTLQHELQKFMRLFARAERPTASQSDAVREPGLGFGDIAAASQHVTVRRGLKARLFKRKDDFLA